MAENETLDLRQTPRWNHARQLLERGASPEEVAAEVRRCLHWTLRRLGELMPMPLADLIRCAAAGDPRVAAMVREARKARDYVQIIERLGSFCRDDPEALARRVIGTIAGRFFDQECERLVPSERLPTFQEFERARHDIETRLAAPIKALARELLEHPERSHRMPASLKKAPDDALRSTLSMSLLAEPAKHG